MREVNYTEEERLELKKKMQIFAMEALADLAVKATQRRHDSGELDKPIELEGSIDGVDYYVALGPEGASGENVILIDHMEE